MPVREKKMCEVCGTLVFKLINHIRAKHPQISDEEVSRMNTIQGKLKSARSIDGSCRITYFRCPMIVNLKKCDHSRKLVSILWINSTKLEKLAVKMVNLIFKFYKCNLFF